MKRSFLALILSVIFFLPHSSYAKTSIPICDGFDFPVGAPDGIGYEISGLSWLEKHDYQGDNVPEYHPGEDWNDDNTDKDYGGDSSDAGDPVYAIGDGVIAFASHAGPGWGFVVLIEHRMRDGDIYWSQYAHLDSINNKFLGKNGSVITRGAVLGAVGDYPDNKHTAYHLHFEIRKKYRPATAFVMNWSKEKVEEYYVNPSEFINNNRPSAGQELALEASGRGRASFSWTQSESDEFDRYELYRSESMVGLGEESSREKVYSATKINDLNTKDTGLFSDQDYYYQLVTHYKDGSSGLSNILNVHLEAEVVNLTSDEYHQKNQRIGSGKVVWEDTRRTSASFPTRNALYYYDLGTGEKDEIKIGSAIQRIEGPNSTDINEDYFCYTGKTSRYSKPQIFCHDLRQGIDIQITDSVANQSTPSISEGDYVVWQAGGVIYYTNIAGPAQISEVYPTLGYQHTPRVWGSTVVYKEKRAGNITDLYIKDLESDFIKMVPDTGAGAADVWGDWIVWCNNGSAYLYNYITDEKIVMGNNAWQSPRVDSGVVVWESASEGGNQLNIYNIQNKRSQALDINLRWSADPYISGNLIAFQAPTDPLSDSSSSMDVWLAYF